MAEALTGTQIRRVDLLPFHRLGSSKYKVLGKEYRYALIPPVRPEQLEPLAAVFERAGFRTAAGG